jgi:lysophospholipase L1-like esterase
LCHNGYADFVSLDIAAFGDSITQGLARKYIIDDEGYIIGYDVWGITKPQYGAVRRDWGYEVELDVRIENNFAPLDASVFNWGAPGYTTVDALDCLKKKKNCIDTVLASRENHVILLMFGANDVYPHQAISIDTFIFNLEQLIEKSRSAGVEPILGTITPNTNRKKGFGGEIINEYWNPRIRKLAEEKQVVLADHYAAMINTWSNYNSGDGLHLSRLGNQKMALTWYEALLKSNTLNPPVSIRVSPVMLLLLHDKE